MPVNFSDIPARSMVGRLLRAPLALLPKAAVVPIIQGPLRGKRWVLGSGNHGYWLGSYELAKQLAVLNLVQPGWTCWDVGANVGFYTLFFSKLVGAEGRVIAFEPAPTNIPLLERHVRMNRCTNVEIVKAAITDFDGVAAFDQSPGSSMGRLCEGGQVEVRCWTADSLLRRGSIPLPHLIKIDVEGSEAAVLRGADHLLSLHKPLLLVATHGSKPHTECLELLAESGYSVSTLQHKGNPLADELIACSH